MCTGAPNTPFVGFQNKVTVSPERDLNPRPSPYKGLALARLSYRGTSCVLEVSYLGDIYVRVVDICVGSPVLDVALGGIFDPVDVYASGALRALYPPRPDP